MPEKNIALRRFQVISIIVLSLIVLHIVVNADTTSNHQVGAKIKTEKPHTPPQPKPIAKTTKTTKTTEVKTEYEDPFKIGLNPERDYLILVNEKNPYQFDGDYDKALQKDLIYVSNIYEEPVQIEKGAYLAFSLLRNHLIQHENIRIDLFYSYRSESEQEWYCEQNVGFDKKAKTEHVIDTPGYTERHTGLLIHIKILQPFGCNGESIWVSELQDSQANENPDFKKVHENLAKFGFIMRYPEGKEEITGSPARPYEIRFVGSSKIAQIIVNNQLTLEEYLENAEKYNK